MEPNNIQKSFDETLADCNLLNLGIDISEIAIDSILQDGLLKELPIVGTIINLSKLSANIQDKLFLKKILTFLNGLRDISPEKRKEMIEKIDKSKEFRIRVGEKLLYIVDSCDDHEISELIGILFRSYIEEKINYDDFLKASSVLNKLSISDFKWFTKDRKYHNFDLSDIGDLISSGLFELYYEQLDVRVIEEDDYKKLRENPNADKYKTEVEGGGISVLLSRAGEIILEVFCKSYKKPKTMKI